MTNKEAAEIIKTAKEKCSDEEREAFEKAIRVMNDLVYCHERRLLKLRGMDGTCGHVMTTVRPYDYCSAA